MKSTERTQNQNGEKGAEKQEENLTIKRISKISNYGIFKSFVWKENTKLPPFRRYNLFYGWNGTGKSTLAKMFAHLEEAKRTESDEEQNNNLLVSFENGEAEITLLPKGESGVDQTKKFSKFSVKFNTSCSERSKLPQVKVFNKDFVKKNIFTEDGAKGIVVIGEDSIKKKEDIEAKERKHEEVIKEIEVIDEKLTKKNESFQHFKSDKAKEIKIMENSIIEWKTSFYNTDHFEKTAEEFSKFPEGEVAKKLLSKEMEISHLKYIKKPPMSKIDELEFDLPDIGAIIRRGVEACKTFIKEPDRVQENNDEFAKEEGANNWKKENLEWLKDGLEKYSEKQGENHCLFCKQTLPTHLLETLENYIKKVEAERVKIQQEAKKENTLINSSGSRECSRLLKEIDNIQNEINEARKSFEKFPEQVSVNFGIIDEEFRGDFLKKYYSLDSLKHSILYSFPFLERLLEKKREAPFNNIRKDELNEIVIEENALSKWKEQLFDLNDIFKKHNNKIEKFSDDVDTKRKALIKHYVAVNYPEYINFKNEITELEGEIKDAEVKKKMIDKKIVELRNEISNVKLSAEKMNDDLAAYFGRKEFTFKVEKDDYQINRNGVPIDSDLSEGEKTAVAFIYFLQTLSEDSFSLENGVVVIDDPISSLDDNALYSAFSLMKSKTSEAKQLFVLTHNFNFFKMLKVWFRRIECVEYYMLESGFAEKTASKNSEVNKGIREFAIRTSSIKPLDKLLKNYLSEYHYLFKQVYDASKLDRPLNLEKNYYLPNIMRKMLESFLLTQNPTFHFDSLWKELKAIDDNEKKKLENIDDHVDFLNKYSHKNNDLIINDTLFVLLDLKPILKGVLEIIEKVNSSHYESMVKLVTPKQAKSTPKTH